MTAALGNGRTTFHRDRRRRELAPSQVEKARSSRRSRFARRAQLRPITSIGRVRRCGYALDPQKGAPGVRITTNPDGTRSAGYAGLATCGSVWCCPQCAAVVAVSRADEIGQVMHAVHAAGGSSFLWTGTVRHGAADRLGLSREDRARRSQLDQRRRWRNRLHKISQRRDERELAEQMGWDVDHAAAEADEIAETSIRRDIAGQDPECATTGQTANAQAEADTAELAALNEARGLWDVVTEAWHAATSGKAWTKAQEVGGGLVGWVKVTEVTDGGTPALLVGCSDRDCYSGKGWHVHVHALICFADDISEELAAGAVGSRMFAAWRSKLVSMGFDASEEHGWDMRKTTAGDGNAIHDYLMKQAHEVAGGHRKEGRRHGGRTPMQLLAIAVETYRVEDLGRWWAWEAASEGRKQLTWSRGLREFAGLGAELTDEQIVEETIGEVEGLDLEDEGWRWITRHHLETDLLDAAEIAGVTGAHRWLADYGLTWIDIDPNDLVKQPPTDLPRVVQSA